MQTPSQIGPYTIVRELGRGGMGVVYVAHDPHAGRQVALKLMLEEDPGAIERFAIEARATAALDHPNLVRIHDAGVHAGQPYYAMDLVDGRPLDDVLKAHGPLPPAQAARIAEAIARGLAHAHERGILHRDMKPANVLLLASGQPLVTDFGLAKDLNASYEALTKTGQSLGTPAYMPPEQADGDKPAIGPHSDVYAIGATLYALLTGHPPFKGSNLLNILRQVFTEIPVHPSELRPGIAPALDVVCMKCLEKDPAARYPSAQELADDLKRFVAGEPILATPPPLSVRMRRGVKHHAARIAVVVAVLLFTLAGTYEIAKKVRRDEAITALRAEVMRTLSTSEGEPLKALPDRAQVAALTSRLHALQGTTSSDDLAKADTHLRLVAALVSAETDPEAARGVRDALQGASLEPGWLDALEIRLAALDPESTPSEAERKALRRTPRLGIVDLLAWRTLVRAHTESLNGPRIQELLDALKRVEAVRGLTPAERRTRIKLLRTRAEDADRAALRDTLRSLGPGDLTPRFVSDHVRALLGAGRSEEALTWILEVGGGARLEDQRLRARFDWAAPIRRWLDALDPVSDARWIEVQESALEALDLEFREQLGRDWREHKVGGFATDKTLNARYHQLLDDAPLRRRLAACARLAVLFGTPIEATGWRPFRDAITTHGNQDWKRNPAATRGALELFKLCCEVCDADDVATLRSLNPVSRVFKMREREYPNLAPFLRRFVRLETTELADRQFGRLDLADALVLAGRNAINDGDTPARKAAFAEARSVLDAFDAEPEVLRKPDAQSLAWLYRFRMLRLEGHMRRAQKAIDRAILLFGAEPHYHKERGEFLAQRGPEHHAEAIASLISYANKSLELGEGLQTASELAWTLARRDPELVRSLKPLAGTMTRLDTRSTDWLLRSAYIGLLEKEELSAVLEDLDAASRGRGGLASRAKALHDALKAGKNLGVVQSELRELLLRERPTPPR